MLKSRLITALGLCIVLSGLCGTRAMANSHGPLQFTSAPVLVAGSDLAPGALYRFADVADGLDAYVEVVALHQARLLTLDDNSSFKNALQPVIQTAASNSSAQFEVTLIDSDGEVIAYRELNVSDSAGNGQSLRIYDASHFTLESDSFLNVQSNAPGIVSISNSGVRNPLSESSQYAVSVALADSPNLRFDIERATPGIGKAILRFNEVKFHAAEFHNVNDPPVATDDHHVTLRNESVSVGAGRGLLANDRDVDLNIDDDFLSIQSFSVGSSVHLPDSVAHAVGGIVSVASDGSYQFIPAVNYVGQVASVDYLLTDNKGGTDSGTLSLSIVNDPVRNRKTENAIVLELRIDEDINADGFLNLDELQGLIDVTVTLPDTAVVGERLEIASQSESSTVVLNAEYLESGVVAAAFQLPAAGEMLRLAATHSDINGDPHSQVTASLSVDLSPNEKPAIYIDEDVDNNGFLSAEEYKDILTVSVELPSSAVVNDIVHVTVGDNTQQLILTPLNIAEGVVNLSFPVVEDGNTMSVVASIADEAGNISETGSDSVFVDTTAPSQPTVRSSLQADATPVVAGTLPTDSDYVLAVEIDGITYVSGDTHLVEQANGQWQLQVPAADALSDGTYNVVVTVTDIAGNASTDSTVHELVIDLVSPRLLAVSPSPSSDAAPVLSGTTDQPDNESVVLQLQSGVNLCVATVEAGAWSCRSRRVLRVGENQLTASTADTAGNVAEYAFVVEVADNADTDSDGIADDIEGTVDSDGDGIPDYTDLDSDNDGILDQHEGMLDTDNDGKRDYIDTDSDNDGITDIIETGLQLSGVNGPVGANGVIDVFESGTDSGVLPLPVDSDRDMAPDYKDLDSDNDGVSDSDENAKSAGGKPVDTDVDLIPDYRDLDSDQDGIADLVELFYEDVDNDFRLDGFVDSDLDGVHDNVLINKELVDVDRDSIPNYLDLDSDGDGLSDLVESGMDDIDSNGKLDVYLDNNNDGLPNSVDALYTLGNDEDSDGVDDLYDSDYITDSDSDSDGITDAFDMDANGDGIIDDHAGFADGLESVYEYNPTAGAVLRTGTGALGSGCVLINDHNAVRSTRIDVFLVVLLIGATCGLKRRRQYVL